MREFPYRTFITLPAFGSRLLRLQNPGTGVPAEVFLFFQVARTGIFDADLSLGGRVGV